MIDVSISPSLPIAPYVARLWCIGSIQHCMIVANSSCFSASATLQHLYAPILEFADAIQHSNSYRNRHRSCKRAQYTIARQHTTPLHGLAVTLVVPTRQTQQEFHTPECRYSRKSSR